ncbi:hypothetical protein HUF15_40095 [Streptomyces samsunensis]|uniref:Uncharacterized protein n=2 Tax=Streptomyces TaxID=1883 RepID=A0ABX6VZP7_STRMQ|nr:MULTISPECIES: DUF6643 family protein [Streptomyces]MYU19098.1 hypothetical protein [Streptomyces sp. SID8361]AQA10380.1 hypothetical protein BV401_07630 [Streptomyces autolyticus]ATL80991.1 large adhesin [Streptomyces malaysiensis]MCC4322306.1 hypothetical protein [Streptomyces malaysiensis]MCD9594833.1 hypothetical protein [Streptomyces sp. 8ZJF_21]
MTSPRSTYGGGYYSSPSFPDTPIYDSLVAERGTPQIAPIRVPSAYDTGSHLPALPSALPALPAAPSPQPMHQGYQQQAPQPTGLQQAHSPYIPPQPTGPRGYPGAQQPQQMQRPGPASPMGYEAMRPAMTRPAAPRPAAPAPSPYDDPYGRQQYPGGRSPHPGGGY